MATETAERWLWFWFGEAIGWVLSANCRAALAGHRTEARARTRATRANKVLDREGSRMDLARRSTNVSLRVEDVRERDANKQASKQASTYCCDGESRCPYLERLFFNYDCCRPTNRAYLDEVRVNRGNMLPTFPFGALLREDRSDSKASKVGGDATHVSKYLPISYIQFSTSTSTRGHQGLTRNDPGTSDRNPFSGWKQDDWPNTMDGCWAVDDDDDDDDKALVAIFV
ncbi:hypothetical protein LY76DRAFT_606578 [Colletotrichum caudatum]|nr:hypothetical protein LY76DRAFT_606578 [Colletotrichum caudatum]